MERFSKSAEAKVLKVDSDQGVVYGYAVVCKEEGKDYFDLQNDHIPEDVMRSASTTFMEGAREMKEMHLGVCKGQIVHSLPLTSELAEALGVKGVEKTGWIVGVKPNDASVIEKFKSGALTGFSIGGSGEYQEVG